MAKRIDLRGVRFGRLVAVCRINERGKAIWLCQCDCGQSKIILQSNLRNNNAKSCGCWQREVAAERAKKRIKHGQHNSITYSSWKHMKRRCNPDDPEYWPYYGARGIKIDPRWNKFEAFFEDMGPRPSRKFTLDRINNDGNYEPGNCRWATRAQQAKNQRLLHGERHHQAKLTSEQVKKAYLSKIPARKLAEDWGVTKGAIYQIRQGRTWRRITKELYYDSDGHVAA